MEIRTSVFPTDTEKYYYNKSADKHITVRGVPDLLEKETVLVPLYTSNHRQVAFYMRNGDVEHACPLHMDRTDNSHIVKSIF